MSFVSFAIYIDSELSLNLIEDGAVKVKTEEK